MGKDISIDLGTSRIRVYVRSRGIVFDEPSLMAVNWRTRGLEAIGNEAEELLVENPGQYISVRPLTRGAITDLRLSESLLTKLLERSSSRSFSKPRVIICIPSLVTPVEKRALKEATTRAGAAEVSFMEQAFAAGIGSGLPLSEPIGSMVVDIGGGKTEATVISFGGIVASSLVRFGGMDLDFAIQAQLRKKYGLAVNERVAEELKILLGSACERNTDLIAEVHGRDCMSGEPLTESVYANSLFEALDELLIKIISAAKDALAKTPPDLANDLLEVGVCLTGGTALLHEIENRLSDETMLPVYTAPDPLNSVVKGAGIAIEEYGFGNLVGKSAQTSVVSSGTRKRRRRHKNFK